MVSRRNDRVRVLLLLAALLILTGCSTPPDTDTALCSPSDDKTDSSIIAWLRKQAIPLGDDSIAGSGDLEPLTAILRNARIVAVGEATHGTREFSDVKRRLFQFLVERMGFTTLAMEVNAPEADRLNAYLETGDGDPYQLLTGLHVWPWDTQDVAELIEWMRQYNERSGPMAQVTFKGFDMQLPHAAMDEWVNYVHAVDPSNTIVNVGLACYRRYQDTTFGYADADPQVRTNCRQGMEQAFANLTQQRERYELASSMNDYENALHNARLVLQAEERYRAMDNRDRRDAFMAENVEWILDQAGPQAKVMLWAHNTHVDADLPMVASMGTFLRERYGEGFFSVGLSFYAGSFNAMAFNTVKNRYGDVSSQQAGIPPGNSYEAYFHAVGLPQFMIDLRALSAARPSPELQWLTGPHPFRSIGTSYDPSRPLDYCYQARLPAEFDLLLYFDRSSPSRLLEQ